VAAAGTGHWWPKRLDEGHPKVLSVLPSACVAFGPLRARTRRSRTNPCRVTCIPRGPLAKERSRICRKADDYIHSPMPAQDKPEYATANALEVVLDTNVVLDWQVFRDPAAAPLVAALETGRLRWVATQAMLDELADVLTRPLPDRFESKRKHSLTLHFSDLCMVLPSPSVAAAGRLICSDPADQKFIDLAVSRPCRWLFSHDKALLRLARRAQDRGVIVTPPRAWVGV
jgi:uncharacterized protein